MSLTGDQPAGKVPDDLLQAETEVVIEHTLTRYHAIHRLTNQLALPDGA